MDVTRLNGFIWDWRSFVEERTPREKDDIVNFLGYKLIRYRHVYYIFLISVKYLNY